MTYSEISSLKYDISNPVLKEWSEKYGIVDMCRFIQMCLQSGSGWLGGERIDREFMDNLSVRDVEIYEKVTDWLKGNRS